MKIDIDPQTEERLREIAACGHISPETLAAAMLVQQTQNQAQVRYWRECAEDDATLKAMKNGDYIQHEDMMTWLDELANE